MTVAVGLGLMEFPFKGAQGYWRWVDLAEAGGADSIWQTDRLLSAQPMLECMTAMAALAGRTRRLKFGMNVVSLALRDPVLLAKHTVQAIVWDHWQDNQPHELQSSGLHDASGRPKPSLQALLDLRRSVG